VRRENPKQREQRVGAYSGISFRGDCGQVGSGSGGAIGICRFIVDDCGWERVGLSWGRGWGNNAVNAHRQDWLRHGGASAR
jgi:hypothetical protein